MLKRISDLIDVKSLVTLAMTAAMIALLFTPRKEINPETLSLFCASYGATIAYFFSRKSTSEDESAAADSGSNSAAGDDESEAG